MTKILNESKKQRKIDKLRSFYNFWQKVSSIEFVVRKKKKDHYFLTKISEEIKCFIEKWIFAIFVKICIINRDPDCKK